MKEDKVSKERIKILQSYAGAKPDGVIGKETVTKLSQKLGKNKTQIVHFLANIHHESGGYNIVRENMNYSAKRIMEIFGVGKHSAKVTQSEANYLAGKPYELAERVYGLGNPSKAKELGNTKVGDGFKYRGGGALQITGGNAYKKYGGQELYNNPDLVGTSSYYFTTAIAEFDQSKIWDLAKDLSENSIRAVCKKVNGGYNGLDDRRNKVKYYSQFM